MDNLYKPIKQDRAALNRGTQKMHVHNLKAAGRIEDCSCPYCHAQVFKFKAKHKFLTLNGSDHHCKDMPTHRYKLMTNIKIDVLMDLLEAAKEQGAETIALFNADGDRIFNPVSIEGTMIENEVEFE